MQATPFCLQAFKGIFLRGAIGTVADETPEFDGQFLNVPVDLAADFRSIRYVQIASPQGKSEINALTNTNGPQMP